MTEVPLQPADDAPSPGTRLPHVPRLSIAYIMGWTAATAVLLAVMRQTSMSQTSMSFSRESPWAIVFIALQSTLIGWIFFGGLLILWHAVRGTLWPLEPGEWLTLCLANLFFFMIGTQWVRRCLYEWGGMSFFEWSTAIAFVQLGGMAGGYVVAAVVQRRRPLWCGLFATIGVPPLTVMLLAWLGWLSRTTVVFWVMLLIAEIVGLVAFLAAAIVSDRRRREPRHWLHWSGIVVTCLYLILMMGTALFGPY